ncbi:MAG: hypothetical protein UV73_C0005G0071 [Candidatus Gottesmanbacteria bacterium GW2011_GWA2_43_14]|uniref:Cupin fold metalloprotein WbuC cupin domain-containing protein n=1 Tax=Candidatus Gottesmanbacteria bacterium GW2011_GWA2_43_14 TaxID=1618443 RepID=A0A0G1DJG5_9BACT|nr:MAG: hypothetical protein UV73_C0005G0071 [Candidatus Gottesmanbacteria bacterium GW2011_GWA2_43_14]
MIPFKSIKVNHDKLGRSLTYIAVAKNPLLSGVTIQEMLKLSQRKNNCDLRICLHRNTDEHLHQMIILHHKGIYRRPQKHIYRDEAYQIIAGRMVLFLFDAKGNVNNAEILAKNGNFICRIGRGFWHLTIPLTAYVIFQEIKSGKFNRSLDAVYPSWAPAGDNQAENKVYYQKLLKRVIKTG